MSVLCTTCPLCGGTMEMTYYVGDTLSYAKCNDCKREAGYTGAFDSDRLRARMIEVAKRYPRPEGNESHATEGEPMP